MKEIVLAPYQLAVLLFRFVLVSAAQRNTYQFKNVHENQTISTTTIYKIEMLSLS